jgi:hypothetical protein
MIMKQLLGQLFCCVLLVVSACPSKGQTSKELLKLDAAEWFYFSPSAVYVVSFERIAEFSDAGPYSYRMDIHDFRRRCVVFQDTLYDNYADRDHVFWINDSLLFVSSKGVLTVRSGNYEKVVIPNLLQVVGYDLSRRKVLYVTADSRGELLNSIENNHVRTITVLDRIAFEMEGAPAIILQCSRTGGRYYALEYSEDSIWVVTIDSLDLISRPWDRVSFRPDRLHVIAITDRLVGILSIKDSILRVFRRKPVSKQLLFSGVSSVVPGGDQLYFSSSGGLQRLSIDGNTETIISNNEVKGKYLVEVTGNGFCFSSILGVDYGHGYYRGETVLLYFLGKKEMMSR